MTALKTSTNELRKVNVTVDLSFVRPVLLGTSALLALVGFVGTWSMAVPLASATLAVGTIVVETDRKVVQHIDGGVVTKISVHDGDLVQVNQLLIKLDDTRLRSTLATLKPLLLMNTAQIERLNAERDGLEKMQTSSLPEMSDPEYLQFREQQQYNFDARRNGLIARIHAQEDERRQYRATIDGQKQQKEACQAKYDLDQQDLSVATDLAIRGFGTKQRVREMQRHLASDKGECSSYSAHILEAEHKVSQSVQEVDRIRANFAESVEAEREKAMKENLDLLDRFRTTSDQLSRTNILAPARGYVVNMFLHTEGGVIGPGMPLLEIVPDTDRLVAEAQITPTEAQSVKFGQAAKIRLAADDGNDAPIATGTVLSVSADRIYDRQRSSAFFLIRVGIDPSELTRVKGSSLRPGMSVELMIEKGHRTLFNYLLSPIFLFFAGALHE